MEYNPYFRNKKSVKEMKVRRIQAHNLGFPGCRNLSIRHMYWSPYIVLEVLGALTKSKALALS